jgi:hypothetical protein
LRIPENETSLTISCLQPAKTAFDPRLKAIMNLPPHLSERPLPPLDFPLVVSSGLQLTCPRSAAESLSAQMTSAARFDVITSQLIEIAGSIVNAGHSVEVVEFSPRAILGPLVLRSWQNDRLKQQPPPNAPEMRFIQFIG